MYYTTTSLTFLSGMQSDHAAGAWKFWGITQVISGFGFKENAADQYIYQKFKRSRLIFLVLYMDHILLGSNNIDLLLEI